MVIEPGNIFYCHLSPDDAEEIVASTIAKGEVIDRPDFCKECHSCVDLCPMTITPCEGPMKKGEESLCAKCGAQLTMAENIPDTCVLCDLGRGFKCTRQAS